MPRKVDIRDYQNHGAKPFEQLPDEEDYVYLSSLKKNPGQRKGGFHDPDLPAGETGEFNRSKAYGHTAGYPEGHDVERENQDEGTVQNAPRHKEDHSKSDT